MIQIIETKRLILSDWEIIDTEPYYRINQDPMVVKFLGKSMTWDEVNEFIAIANACQEQHGYTFWAARIRKSNTLIGSIGLSHTTFKSHFTPSVELSWRLGSQYWDNGYATEGAKAILSYGFNTCALKEIVSFTALNNVRSIRVMDKIGLKRDSNGDFNHPNLSIDHPLSKHILYRLTSKEYLNKK